jgi:hypothetical protein
MTKKNTIILLFFVLSLAQAQGQLLRDNFSRSATTDIAGSQKWRRVLNLNDTSATIQLNADSTVSPRNLLGPFNRGAAYWDSALSGGIQVGMILRKKNGNDGVPSFHIHVMDDSSWATGNGYALRFQANPGQDRMDIQRIAGSGVDTPTVTLLASLDREFAEGDTLILKISPDGRKTGVVYGVGGSRDSISVVDTVYHPASWLAWIQGRVFADPLKVDNFMLGPIPFPITATAGPGGAISPEGTVLVDPGGAQSFSITPDPGFFILDVKVDTVSVGATGGYMFIPVYGPHTIEAFFDTAAYTITATAGPNGTITPSGPVTAPGFTSRTFTIAPNAGHHIDSVVVDGVTRGAVTSHTFTNIVANHAIAAYFSVNTLTITATSSAGGSILPYGSVVVTEGGSQSFTVAPNAGYHIDSVVADGVNQGAITSFPFNNVTAAHSIAAYFSINTYTITATAAAGGTMTPSGAVSVSHGSNRAFAIAPNTGHHVDSVVVDGANQGAITGYQFDSVTAAHSIAAYFSINAYTVTSGASSGGSIYPFGVVSANYGDDPLFTITPNTGSHIDSVVVDGVDQGVIASYTFTGIAANHAIQAYFSINTYAITATAAAGGGISPSGVVVANYGQNRAFTIAPNTGHHIDSVVVDGADQGALAAWQFDDVTSAHSISAYFSINVYTVAAVQAPNGSISPAGTTPVQWGDSVAYSILPDTGYYVTALHVDSAALGAAESYTFNDVSSNHTISATFAIRTFTVTSTASAGGSVSPQGAVTAAWGDTVTIDVRPDVGHHIDSVLVDGMNLGRPTVYAFRNVTANHTLAAHFSIDVFTIAASAGAGGTISPSGNVPVNYGEAQPFTIAPSAGYRIDSVLVDGVNAGAVASYNFTFVTAAHSIAAYFSLRTFHVSATAGAGGVISPAGNIGVTWGDSLAFTITPDTGYHIDSVVVDGVNAGSGPTYVFRNISADHLIEAYFSETAFTVAASASGTGTITPTGTVGVSFGGSQLFTMTPSAGCHLDSVIVDGVNVGAPSTYRFTIVTANHTIAAYFSINYYTITAAAGTGGAITPSGSMSLVHGSSQSYAIVPSTGYRIQDVLVDGASVGRPASYSFTNLSAGHTIQALFARITFSVSANSGPNGSVSPAGASTVAWGDSITYTITPGSGYFIEGVTVDGVALGLVPGYTFRNVTADHAISATFTGNATPTAFALVSPADGISVPPAALRALRFVWRKSFDANSGDVLRYVLTLSGPNVNFNSFEVADTAVTLDLRGLAIVNYSAYRWTVRVSDGTVTVASPDTFEITVNPATAVGNGTRGVPGEFGLGQNYPNPFNPTTSVPFDLPERAEVTLRIYNIIGAEVATLAEGESVPAGSYVREADFSGLPSGVYFCRMSATGESGTAFGKTVRLVLMR